MELRQLRYFVKTCELRSMGRAALELEDIEANKRRLAKIDAASFEPSIFAPALTLPLIGRMARLR